MYIVYIYIYIAWLTSRFSLAITQKFFLKLQHWQNCIIIAQNVVTKIHPSMKLQIYKK